VTRLLGFASSTSSKQELLDLRELVEQAVTEMRPRLLERQVEIQVSFSDAAVIRGDRERVVQCVIEMLSNAADYSPVSATIRVTAARSPARPGFVDLLFSDQGPGIPPHIADRVFDLFFTTRPGGTAFGLASVKQTVQSHGGHVEVVPSITGGACLRVSLPTSDRPKNRR
jgi:signal transduction histidine kinase